MLLTCLTTNYLSDLYCFELQFSDVNLLSPAARHKCCIFHVFIIFISIVLFPSLAPLFKLFGANIFSKEAIKFFTKTIEDSIKGGNNLRQSFGDVENKVSVSNDAE